MSTSGCGQMGIRARACPGDRLPAAAPGQRMRSPRLPSCRISYGAWAGRGADRKPDRGSQSSHHEAAEVVMRSGGVRGSGAVPAMPRRVRAGVSGPSCWSAVAAAGSSSSSARAAAAAADGGGAASGRAGPAAAPDEGRDSPRHARAALALIGRHAGGMSPSPCTDGDRPTGAPDPTRTPKGAGRWLRPTRLLLPRAGERE